MAAPLLTPKKKIISGLKKNIYIEKENDIAERMSHSIIEPW